MGQFYIGCADFYKAAKLFLQICEREVDDTDTDEDREVDMHNAIDLLVAAAYSFHSADDAISSSLTAKAPEAEQNHLHELRRSFRLLSDKIILLLSTRGPRTVTAIGLYNCIVNLETEVVRLGRQITNLPPLPRLN